MTVTPLLVPDPDSGRGHDRSLLPPQDVAAEQAVLGAAMLSKTALDSLTDLGLRPEHFYRPSHELVWAAVLRLVEDRQPVDAHTVGDALTRTGELSRTGGPTYLVDLLQAVTSTASATFHARIVMERWTLRQLGEAGDRVAQLARGDGMGDVDDRVDAAQQAVQAVADGRHQPAGDDTLDLAVDATLEQLESGAAPRQPTGMADLDRILVGGLAPGSVTTVAARPAVGKTIVGLQIALHVALMQGRPVGYTSLEMGREDLLLRAYSSVGAVDYGRLQSAPNPPLTESEWRKVAEVSGRIRQSDLWIPDRRTATVSTVRADIRRMARRKGLCALWVVDYLQLVTPSDRRVGREQQVAGMMRLLKLTALETGVPILLLAQLNRDSEKSGREPVLTDLRESGAIEQDSDNVVLLHRDLEGAPDLMGVRVAKNRRGPMAGYACTFEGQYQRVKARQWTPGDALDRRP